MGTVDFRTATCNDCTVKTITYYKYNSPGFTVNALIIAKLYSPLVKMARCKRENVFYNWGSLVWVGLFILIKLILFLTILKVLQDRTFLVNR